MQLVDPDSVASDERPISKANAFVRDLTQFLGIEDLAHRRLLQPSYVDKLNGR
jgi:hypothetical protein